MKADKRIFVGGLGKCGTSMVWSIMGQHPAISVKRKEMRIISDPGGIEDFYYTLTTNYNPWKAHNGFRRFFLLLKRLNLDVPLNDFYEKLFPSRFKHQQGDEPYTLFEDGKIFEHFVHRFSLEDTKKIFKEIIDKIMLYNQDKNSWIDATPFNIFSLPFIDEVLQDYKFIHLIKDPRDAAAVYTRTQWAPRSLDAIYFWLESYYAKLIEMRHLMKDKNKYLEIKLEDIINNQVKEFNKMFEFIDLGLINYHIHTMDKNKIGEWKNHLEKEKINELFSPFCKEFEYKI